jgi:large subunit ribosomal protein L17
MRHGKKFNHLGRKVGHRHAMLSNMACSLIEHKQINTTTAKAKALRVYIEPIITKCKDDSTHSRRIVFGYLKSKEAVTELFREIAPKVAERPGGYTRIIKTGFRQGDGAEMAMIELVDFNELYSPSEKKTKSRRRRKSTGSEGAQASPAVAEATVVEETPTAEVAAEVEGVAEVETLAAEAVEAPETEASAESTETEESTDETKDDSEEEKKA